MWSGSTRFRVQAFQFEFGFFELNQVLEVDIEGLANGSDDGGVQFLNWLRGCQPIETLFIHFEATLP